MSVREKKSAENRKVGKEHNKESFSDFGLFWKRFRNKNPTHLFLNKKQRTVNILPKEAYRAFNFY